MNTTLERTISIAQAAELLRVKLPVLDKLLREDAICTLYGERGKGGRLRLSLSDLPIIEAAYKLIELKVPRPAVRDLSGRASVMLQEHPDSNIFLSYHKDANIVVIAPEIAQMTKIIRDGVSAVFINARRADELSHDADMLSAPRLRGRPKIDRVRYRQTRLQRGLRRRRHRGRCSGNPTTQRRVTATAGALPVVVVDTSSLYGHNSRRTIVEACNAGKLWPWVRRMSSRN